MKIKKGQEIKFKIPEASNEIYNAEVHLVGKKIDKVTRTVKIHGHLHNKTKNEFDIGMFVDANIETTNKKGFALPEDAIIEDDDRLVILKLEKQENDNYTFTPIEIEIGKKHNGFVEIISNHIAKTDKILIKGGFVLVSAESGGHLH